MSAMLVMAAVLLGAGVPQGPVGRPATIVPGAELIPADAQGVVWVRTGAAGATAIGGIAETLQALEQRGVNPLVGLARHAESMLGLEPGGAGRIAERGISLSWLQADGEAGDEWLLIAELPDAEAKQLASLPRRFADGGSMLRTALAGAIEVHAVHLGDRGAFAFALADRRLIAAGRAATVEAALARRGQRDDSLAQAPAWTSFAAKVGAGTPVPAGAWLHGRALLRALDALHPPGMRGRLQAAYEQQFMHRVASVGFALTERDGQLEQLYLCMFPGIRGDLLRALSEPRAPVAPGVAAFVPAAAVGWVAGRATAPMLFDNGLHVLRIYAPDHAEALATWFEGLRASRGVSGREDLLGTLGDQFVAVQFEPDDAQTAQHALLVDVRDSWRLRNAIRRLVADRTLPVATQKVGEIELHQLLVPDLVASLPLWFTVTSRHLILASSERAARAMIAQLDAPSPNAPVAAVLAQAIPDVQWQGVTRWDLQMQSFLALAASICAEDPDLASAIANLAAADRTPVFGRLFVDGTSLAWQVGSRRPEPAFLVGALTGARHVARRLGVAGEAEQRANVARNAGELLAQIAAAQKRFAESARLDADRDGTGEHGTLVDLAVAGLIRIQDLGADLGDDLFERDGMLLTLLLPPAPDLAERHFAIVAWPARNQTGRVLAATERSDGLYNDLLAGARGIRRMAPPDVWIGGEFGGRMTSGWRELEPAKGNATATPVVEDVTRLTPAETALFERIVALEATPGARAPKEVVDALGSEKPALAARAARALGMLRATEAVPKLCETVSIHPDLDVQRHALAALRALRDPRSVQISLQALGSDDPTLRAIAAANLGELRERSAVRPLLAMLSLEGTSQVDRVQALVALADIGEPEAMLPAAQAVGERSGDLAEALAYLVATLAPKLPAAEEADALLALLDHEATLVRRHAIQRLGALRVRNTVAALEGKLATESDDALRPLIEVALRSIRGETRVRDDEPDRWAQVTGWLAARWRDLRTRWQALPDDRRLIFGGGAAGALLLLLLVRMLRRRRRRKAEVDHLASLVAPSEEYLESHEPAGEYDDVDAVYRQETEVGAGAGGGIRMPSRPPSAPSSGPWHPVG